MRQVAIAFETTGPSPKDGHRFSEIVAIEQENGVRVGKPVRFLLKSGKNPGGPSAFPAALIKLKSIVGDAPVIVMSAGHWRRFLRVELRTIKRHGAGHLLGKVIDVGGWAHQRFPRQRKDVAAIAQRLGIEVEAGLAGLEREAELLRLISMKINTSVEPVAPESSGSEALALSIPLQDSALTEPTVLIGRNLVEKIGWFWRRLTDKV